MKAVVQVVSSASLSVENKIISEIDKGLVVFFCVEENDEVAKLEYFAKKIANLRIFCDENGKMNNSVIDKKGEILLVSQFTLAGECEHGNRPSFISAEKPARANSLYLQLSKILTENYGLTVKMGVFGADMQIKQVNEGPVTIILSK